MEGDESTIVYVSHLGYRIKVGKKRDSRTFSGLDDITFQLFDGETLGVIGESGSGKSLLLKIITGMIRPTEGDVYIGLRPETMVRIIDLEGRVGRLQTQRGDVVESISPEQLADVNDLWNLRDEFSLTRNTEGRNRPTRRDVQAIYQDMPVPLDPKRTAWDAIAEAFKRVTDLTEDEIDDRIREVSAAAGIRETVMRKTPRDLNAEETQLANIARAIAMEPRLIALDDPTAELDVSAQAQILNTLRDYQYSRGLSYIVASNNLNAIRILSDKVLVLYLGRTVEYATTSEVFSGMLHPYTKMLVSQAPALAGQQSGLESALADVMPDISNAPAGCPFHTRCPVAFKHCGWTPSEIAGLFGELLAFNKDEALKMFPAPKQILPHDNLSTLELVFEPGTRISYDFVEEMQRIIEGRTLLEGGTRLTSIEGMEISTSGDSVIVKVLKPKMPPLVEVRAWHYVSCFQYGGLEGAEATTEAGEKEPAF